MEPYDWNHNGKCDRYDYIIEQEQMDDKVHYSSGRSGGGMSTFAAIHLTALSFIIAAAICVLLDVPDTLQLILFGILMPVIAGVLGAVFELLKK